MVEGGVGVVEREVAAVVEAVVGRGRGCISACKGPEEEYEEEEEVEIEDDKLQYFSFLVEHI